MTADREFVSTTGTRHRLGQVERMDGYEEHFGPVPNWWTACGLAVEKSNPVVRRPGKDCKRCYPKGRVRFDVPMPEPASPETRTTP